MTQMRKEAANTNHLFLSELVICNATLLLSLVVRYHTISWTFTIQPVHCVAMA